MNLFLQQPLQDACLLLLPSLPLIGIFYPIKSKTTGLLENLLPDDTSTQSQQTLPVSCRITCYICEKRLANTCEACVEKSFLWEKCAIPACVEAKNLSSCKQCTEHITCTTRKEYTSRCVFDSECMIELMPEPMRLKVSENRIESEDHVMLFKNSTPEEAFAIFKILVEKGLRGLCITRIHPEVLSKKYRLPQVPSIRMLPSKSCNEDLICTDKPNQLLSLIKKFIKKNPACVVLFHGPEYLHAEKGFEEILQFVQRLKHIAQLTKTQLIISLNPDVFSEKEISAFEQNYEIDETTQRVIDFITGSKRQWYTQH
jgi:hypothetical protein